METVTTSGGFGGIPIGQEILGTASMEVLHFIRKTMTSPASEGLYNVMNILTSTLLVLEHFSNGMYIFTLMVGAFLA